MDASSGDLFPQSRLFLPSFRGDETLYSWCANYHTLSSMPTARQTCLQLFDHSDAGLKHDFPIHLDRLVERTQGFLGTRDEIIFNRTPIGAFFRFIDRARLQAICNLMGSGPEHRVTRMLGLLAIRYGTPAPLKACRACMSVSISESRSSAWRVDHQTPGIYYCDAHGEMLSVANAEAHRRSRSEFLLPHMLAPNDWCETPALSGTAANRLESLAVWSRALRTGTDSSDEPFSPNALRDACHLSAKERGWIGIDGSLHFKRIQQELNLAQVELFDVPGLEFLANAQNVGGGYLGLLMRQSPGIHHPLMFVALLSFLFESPEQFFQCYQVASLASPDALRDVLRSKRHALSDWLQELVITQQLSVNEAANEVGIPVSRALVYLGERGIKWKRRPRIVGTNLEAKLIDRLESGDEPNAIAIDLNLRRGFIKDYLASHPELRQRHQAERFTRRRNAYRTKFLRALEENPAFPIKRIRREIDSGFQWLLKHDRDWLTGILPGIWHR